MDETLTEPSARSTDPWSPVGNTSVPSRAPVSTTPSRRRVLGLAATVGFGGVLAACGGDDDEAGTTPGGDSSSETGTASSESESQDGAGGVLVSAADVPVGGGVILEAQKVVVTQPTDGTFRAFTATCTHQACTVASVAKGTISCACHGSAFSATDGSVQNGPATKPLAEIAVTVQDGQVVET